ncbi:hypothetical protein BHE74_00018538 [Ensete ventricosum]|uniref:Uncharacterized protein n=1 Tax=Ensete ventricosum TaxID=4639 RepID=A0A426Z3H8_ENSVE|nr:hypothetical protein B296_00003845 [Ensete ventricosum]RWW12487.1 hypothetical protein GW17_00023839 [Ensete ventricosum]RWW73584.1 hypothetical protein BHE74_00018538 [Ensete ventricosum]RZS12766.1 hypothetical protein BHM03_00044257 [Ensete ventricosum]
MRFGVLRCVGMVRLEICEMRVVSRLARFTSRLRLFLFPSAPFPHYESVDLRWVVAPKSVAIQDLCGHDISFVKLGKRASSRCHTRGTRQVLYARSCVLNASLESPPN